MNRTDLRRKRLGQILDLAQNYRGWTRRQLARALGRDPTKLIPGSGIPKLDLVIELADVMEWNLDDVVSLFWVQEEEPPADTGEPGTFEALDSDAGQAHRTGNYREMVRIAKRALSCAETGQERARSWNRTAGGWDGMGRYQHALEALQQGLQEKDVDDEFRRMLQSNLANAYYSLWSLLEARSIATDLLQWYDRESPETLRDRKSRAFSAYVAGHTSRRLMEVEPARVDEHAREATEYLGYARTQYLELAAQENDDGFSGIANTCRGGLIEVEVQSGAMDARDGLAILMDGLDATIENPLVSDDTMHADVLESYAWWCIFGCNIALRSLEEERELQQFMAVFTNKADEIAQKIDNWMIRERVFTMEHTRWERAVGCTGFDIPCVVDEDDIRIITGAMARFPAFRGTGMEILKSAKVISAES